MRMMLALILCLGTTAGLRPLTPLGAQEGKPVAPLSQAEFEKLRSELDLKRQTWAKLPWTLTLKEARETAARVKKPIFMIVNTGNVTGFV